MARPPDPFDPPGTCAFALLEPPAPFEPPVAEPPAPFAPPAAVPPAPFAPPVAVPPASFEPPEAGPLAGFEALERGPFAASSLVVALPSGGIPCSEPLWSLTSCELLRSGGVVRSSVELAPPEFGRP